MVRFGTQLGMQRFEKRLLGLAVLAAALSSACTPFKYTDDDDLCSKAKPLPFGVAVKDELSAKTGDISDCKEIKYFKDSQASIEYRLGTAFEKHDLKGTIVLYNGEGQVLDQKSVDPSIFKYNFEVEVKAQKPYYLEFKVTEGDYAYSAQVAFKAVDPCARCDDDEECVDGECNKAIKECDPECDEEAGFLCDDGECKYQCDDGCPKKRGHQCEAASGECVKVLKECRPACKSGYSCNRRNGQCVAVAPKTCAGGCKPGELCQSGKCVPLGGAPKCPPCAANERCDAASAKCVAVSGDADPTGPITGTVTSTVRAPDGTVLYLNRGERHGVKAGKRGSLCGQTFAVTNVYPTRAKAKTSAAIETIGNCNSFSIQR